MRKFLLRVLQIRDFISSKLSEGDLDTCVSLAQLVQDAANVNINLLSEISEESSEEEIENCLSVVQLVLVGMVLDHMLLM